MNKTYNFISDPGHGWLEVPVTEVRASGAKISPYSYRGRVKGEAMAYLEEDCDAGKFLDIMKQKGFEIKINHIDADRECFVRDLAGF